MLDITPIILKTLEPSEASHISEIIWLTDETAAVVYDTQIIEVYDVTKEKCVKTCDFSEAIYSEASSLHSIGSSDSIVIIGTDGKIYKLNLNN